MKQNEAYTKTHRPIAVQRVDSLLDGQHFEALTPAEPVFSPPAAGAGSAGCGLADCLIALFGASACDVRGGSAAAISLTLGGALGGVDEPRFIPCATD